MSLSDAQDGSLSVTSRSALSFLTSAATVDVTTTDFICMTHAIGSFGMIDTVGTPF